MSALEEHTRPGVTKADDASVAGCIASGRAHLAHLPQALLLLVAAVLLVQEEEEQGTGGEAENGRQDFPEPDVGFLLLKQGVEILAAQVILHPLLGGLQFDGVIVQDQLSHTGEYRPHLQHLFRLLDAFGTLPADVMADDVCEGLHGGVEFLIDCL